MTEQEEKILELYSKNLRKRKIIIFVIIFALLMISLIISKIYKDAIEQSNFNDTGTNFQNEIIQEKNNETQKDIIEDTTIITEKQPQENIVETENQITEPIQQVTSEISKTNNENNINNTKSNTKSTNKAVENKQETVNKKPANKDFLFTEGYTMENVSQVAQDYLKSSGYSGECIPLKDNEGIYYGMRVVFH